MSINEQAVVTFPYAREWRRESANDNDSLSVIYDFVAPGSRVLDMGCALGQLGGELKCQKGCMVVGVDCDDRAAAAASRVLDDCLTADLDTIDFESALGGKRFDSIVFADVLEHLQQPERVLRGAQGVLAEGGALLISMPNVAHASVRLALLEGRFDYATSGLLDATHVKFYTKKSFFELLGRAGLVVVDVRSTYLGATDTEIPVKPEGIVNDELIHLVEGLDEATVYQYIVKAIPIRDAEYCRLINVRNANFENTLASRAGQLERSAQREKELLAEIEKLKASIADQERREAEHRDVQRSVLYLAGQVSDQAAKLGPALEQLAQLNAKVERYTNVLPLRLLRRLRARLAGYR